MAATAKEVIKFILEGFREWGITEFTHKNATEKLEKEKKRAEWRVEMTAFIQRPDFDVADPERKRFRRRLQARQECRGRSYSPFTPYRHGDENEMIGLLGDLYAKLAQGGAEQNARIQMFKMILGMEDDREFDAFLENLKHDPFAQMFRATAAGVTGFLNNLAGVKKTPAPTFYTSEDIMSAFTAGRMAGRAFRKKTGPDLEQALNDLISFVHRGRPKGWR